MFQRCFLLCLPQHIGTTGALAWHLHTWQRTAAAGAGPGDAATAPNAQRLSRYSSPARRVPVAGSHCPRSDSGHGGVKGLIRFCVWVILFARRPGARSLPGPTAHAVTLVIDVLRV